MPSLQEIQDLSNEVYKNYSFTGMWPDCYKIAERIKDELIKQYDIKMEYITIRECFPTQGYRHYVVEINSIVTGQSIIIDASFKQFDEQADTPVTAGRNVDPVIVVSPANSYIYYH